MNVTEEIARVVKYHRNKSGLTQKQLADIAGVGKTVIFDIEKGKESIRINTMIKVLNALNIKIKLDSPLMKLMEDENERS